MPWGILLDPRAAREIDRLDGPVQARIWKFLYERLARLEDPRSVGQAMRGSELGDLWKYQVGDHRILAKISDRDVVVVVVRIGHRREIYR